MRQSLDHTVISQARQTDLRDVIMALGGERHRYDKAKYRLADGRVLSLTDTLFYDHTMAQGGAGAIDLVMHVRQCDFSDALAFLTNCVPRPAQSRPQPPAAPAQARERHPFVPPTADGWRWMRVRPYLTEERCLPARIVDALHQAGLVYADHRGNAVFLRHAPDGAVTGAALRSTWPGHDFKGLAPGTVRDAGYFYYHTGERQPYATPSLVLTESPVDTMSVHALRLLADERGRVTLLSTDGAGALPTALIDKALAHGWTVQAGFDNDRAGDQLWQRLKEQYAQETEQGAIWRERPPHGKDWNDSLRYMLQERAQALDHDERGR